MRLVPPKPRLFPFLPFVVLASACGTSASAAPAGEDLPLEYVHDAVTSLHVDEQGDGWVGFGVTAQAFVIPSDRPEMLAFARKAMADGTKVHATVRGGHGDKAATAGKPVDAAGRRAIAVVRLAATPDPQQGR